jgi:mono/diheme cytochrome c family protein
MKRKQIFGTACLCFSLVAALLCYPPFAGSKTADPGNKAPRFKLTSLTKVTAKDKAGKRVTLFDPKNPYDIFINYELGMHCVGFDITYCCVIPPYNSIQAQAVKTGEGGALPRLLSPDDGVSLHYFVRDNSYSEGNKMRYWNVAKDVYGDGKMDEPGDNMANYVWTHLFIYKDLEGTVPENWSESQRLHVGKQIQVPIDSGPTGKNLAGGDLAYAGSKGGNKVFTDSLIPEVKNIQLTLTSSYLWDALGLPLTAFYDSRRKGTIRSISEKDFQPYQYSMVELRDKNGKPVTAKGKPVEFFGTNPVDIPNCYVCHSGQGKAAKMAKEQGLTLSEKEYAYWKNNYSDVSEFMMRQAQASINILEIHDKRHGTSLLKEYNPNTAYNRLGGIGSVNCADCHGDNVSGNLQSPRPGATGYQTMKGPTLTEAIHSVHAGFIPMPDKAGRTQSCQACHPTHWWEEKMNVPGSNPYEIVDQEGNPRFSNSDVRIAGGGCYLRRDAHTNPDVKPPFFLNSVGKWYLKEVSRKDENGKTVSKIRGLYCTNCHNQLAHELYNYDDLKNPVEQEGKTLRNAPLKEVMNAVAKGDALKFKNYYADPIAGAEGDPLRSYYANHTGATLVKATKDSEGKLKLLPWNATEGDAVPYDGASAGKDWWLAAGEPHCADCHLAPFVESMGGDYFPVDQPNKYSLYRYSKAHGTLACQSCHESIHGLYPVRYEGPEKTPDMTSHQQALQFSPDGKYAGPVTCAACHRVNTKGVPAQLAGTGYDNDYWASVALLHFMRSGDEKLPIDKLMEKFPYQKSRKVVTDGWE